MIKANELRIGNVVLFCPDGKRHHTIKPRECKVVAVQQDKVVVLDLGQHLSLWPDQPEMQGIPLTPERLERLGFSNTRGSYWLRVGELIINFDKVWWWSNAWQDDEEFGFDSLVTWREIKYLHQLQNLFLDLTSTELREPVK